MPFQWNKLICGDFALLQDFSQVKKIYKKRQILKTHLGATRPQVYHLNQIEE